jgi:enoyl reductase-like protein
MEIERVSGAETITYEFPAGTTVTTVLEPNNSTTLNFTFSNGSTYSWNSGVWISCFALGNGVGITAGILSANPAIGMLTSTLTGMGCNYVATSGSGGGSDPADGD